MTERHYEHVEMVMIYEDIPPGQLRLYKALLEAGDLGLTFSQLALSTKCTPGETRSTLGALGNRVSQSCGKIYEKPSRLLIERDKSGIYKLSPALLQFMEKTPSLLRSLQENPIEKFSLHSVDAWTFKWDPGKKKGDLDMFQRSSK